jgi:hypothetical protein
MNPDITGKGAPGARKAAGAEAPSSPPTSSSSPRRDLGPGPDPFHGTGINPEAVPTASYAPDSITATDIPAGRAEPPRTPPGHLNPSLDAGSSHHSDNPLSAAVRASAPKDLLDPKKLREKAEKLHVHDHRGMTGSA